MFDKIKKSLFGKSHRHRSYSSSRRGYSQKDNYLWPQTLQKKTQRAQGSSVLEVVVSLVAKHVTAHS